MFHVLGYGPGILLFSVIIFCAGLSCLALGRWKGVAAVIIIIFLVVLIFLALYNWPVKLPNEAPWTPALKTDHLLIPRVILICFLFLVLFHLIRFYITHDLLFINRPKSTESSFQFLDKYPSKYWASRNINSDIN